MDLLKAVGRRGGLWGCVREGKRRREQGWDTEGKRVWVAAKVVIGP